MALRQGLALKINLIRSYRDRLTRRRVARKASSILDRALARAQQRLPTAKSHHCPACGSDIVRFYRFGAHTLCCPMCDSTDRERHLHLSIKQGRLSVPKPGSTILHVAPSETQLSHRLSQLGRLIKGDYEPARYDEETIRIDLMDLAGSPDFDVIVLSHVLEHVPDDWHVMRQLHSKLPVGGQAWIQVPLIYNRTVGGDPTMTAAEREARFGGSDHLRAYGPDLADRLAEVGFDVSQIRSADGTSEDCETYGVNGDVIFLAVRA